MAAFQCPATDGRALVRLRSPLDTKSLPFLCLSRGLTGTVPGWWWVQSPSKWAVMFAWPREHGQGTREQGASFYRLGKRGVSLCGSSPRQRSLSRGPGPEVIMLTAGTCENRAGWDPLSVTTCPHGKTKCWSLGTLWALSAAHAGAAQRHHHHCPFCEGSVATSGWASASASFLSPAQKCFQGSPIVLAHVSFDGSFGVPSCHVPLRAEPFLHSPHLTTLPHCLFPKPSFLWNDRKLP